MKKLLISIIGLMLLIILFVSATKGLSIGKFHILSIGQMNEKSQELDNKIEEAKTETTQNHASMISQMDAAVKKLKEAKSEYDSKTELAEETELGITQIEKYKIEYLWGIIGNYAKGDGLKVDMNIEETTIKDTYNINFTLTGSYLGITNFLYHIENDDELNYKVVDFKIEPADTASSSSSSVSAEQGDSGEDAESGETTSANSGGGTTKNTTVRTGSNTDVLRATFKVENIIINFN